MKTSLIERIFPTPTYVRMNSVGFDISDRSMKFAELTLGKGGLVLARYGETPIPDGILNSGKIEKPAEFKNFLLEFKKIHKFDRVRISLPEEQMYLYTLSMDAVSPKELHNALELSLEEHIPIKASEVVFDYTVLSEKKGAIVVEVTAVPESFVESYLEPFEEAGLTVLSCELETHAIARAVIPNGDVGTYMIVDFGQTRTGISIVSEGGVRFTSTLDIGGIAISNALSHELKISFEEAEKIKSSEGLGAREHSSEAFPIILASVAALRDEINKHYVYWHTHKDENGNPRPEISRLLLCGGNANVPGLVDYLKSTIGVGVGLANPWENINTLEHYLPELSRNNALSYTSALGLALGDFKYD